MKTYDIATAQCQQFLKPRVDWLTKKSKGKGDYWVYLVFVSNNSLQFASYGTAEMTLDRSRTHLVGTAKIYVNEAKSTTGNPFDENHTKMRKITINVNTGKVSIGTSVITAPRCDAGVILGFEAIVWPHEIPFLQLFPPYYVISLSDKFQEIVH